MSMFRPASEISSSESQSSSDESDHGILPTASRKTRGESHSGNGARTASFDRESGTENISEASMDVLMSKLRVIQHG